MYYNIDSQFTKSAKKKIKLSQENINKDKLNYQIGTNILISNKYIKKEIDDLEEKYKPLTDDKLKKRLSILKENFKVLTRR